VVVLKAPPTSLPLDDVSPRDMKAAAALRACQRFRWPGRKSDVASAR
jgi:hypothetical protein